MRTRRPIGTLILVSLIACAPATGTADLNARVWKLQQDSDQLMKQGDVEGALSTVRDMAALDPDHPRVYMQAVLLHRRLNKLADAATMMDQLGPADGPGRAFGDGMVLFMQGSYPDAEGRFEYALQRYRALDHTAGMATATNALGLVAFIGGRFDEAREHYVIAVELLDALGDTAGKTGALSNLATIELHEGRPETALEWQQSLLEAREELGDLPGQALTWRNIGDCRGQLGDTDGALAAYERALELFGSIQDVPGQITTLQQIAKSYARSADWESATRWLDRALEFARATADAALVASVQRTTGALYLAHGRNRDALEPLRHAVTLYEAEGMTREWTDSLILTGTALSALGRLNDARDLLSQALETACALNDAALEASALNGLGMVSLTGGDPAEGLLHHERALALYRAADDRIAERRSLNNLGVTYFYLGNYPRALHFAEESLRLAEVLADPAAIALAQHNVGAILAEQGQHDEALAWMRRSIASRDKLGDSLGAALGRANLAESMLLAGRLEPASREIDLAMETFRVAEDRAGEAFAMNLRGELLLLQGNATEAIAAHLAALETAREAGIVEQRWRAHAGLARARSESGQPEEALREVLLAIDGVDTARARLVSDELKMRFMARKIDLYELALELTLRSGESASAEAVSRGFHLCERARARSLVDLLAESRSPLMRHVDGGLALREEVALDRVRTAALRLSLETDSESRRQARRELADAETALDRLTIEIRRGAPEYAALVYPTPASSTEVREELLEDREVLLEFFVGRHRAWLWVVSRKGSSLHVLDPPQEIARQVTRFVETVSKARVDLTGGEAEAEAAERLAASILPSVDLPAGTRLIVIPDGPLHHVPFEALRRNGRYLVEDHEVVVVPSATTLRLLRDRDRSASPSGFLGVGAPTAGPSDDIPALQYAAQELDQVASLFPETGRTLLTGDEATSTRMRSVSIDEFRYVHFATHGWLESDNPRRSGLWITADEQDAGDDRLTVDEILPLRLRSKLVVLSACRTGAGEMLRGEGLVSLTRSFLHAGSDSVIVSLWDVEDRSTADLMFELYRGMIGGAEPSAALRRAKLSFLRSDRPGRRQIRSWAPFVLVGDPGPTTKVVNRNPADSTSEE